MYHDLLVRIKNGYWAGKESVHLPFSKFDLAIAKALTEAGYVANAEKRAVGKKAMLDVRLKYEAGKPVLTDFRLISKPSRRIYRGYQELQQVKQGHGLGVLSTPVGILTNREARKQKVGGEYLFEIW